MPRLKFESVDQLPRTAIVEQRRVTRLPRARGGAARVTQIALLDLALHGFGAFWTSWSQYKRCVAPAGTAEPIIPSHGLAAQQTFGRIERANCHAKSGLYLAADRNMFEAMHTPPLLTDRAALIRNRLRATDPFLAQIARDELDDRIAMVNRTFTDPIIVGPAPAEFLPSAQRCEDLDHLQLDEGRADLAVHFMALHWANDPVGQIIQMRRALKPDGLFLAVMLGGQTLHELRACLAQAETDITGGLSPRILPMSDIRDMGGLLQRAGLALPVADSHTIRTSYSDVTALMQDLRAFGEGNALAQRLRRTTRRAVFQRCGALYEEQFSEGGKIIATFEMLFLAGWAPADSQPKALRPGSATHRLSDALSLPQTPLED